MSKYDIIFAMPDRSMVQVEEEMFVTFVTWMVHDFCHDIDNSKSNGAFYNLFQAQNTKNRLSKIGQHIVQTGGNPKNLSFQEEIDINCKSVNRIQYIPKNVPDNREEFKTIFYEIYGKDETGKADVFNMLEAYQIIFNVLRDIIEGIKGMIVSGEITDNSIITGVDNHIKDNINGLLKENYQISTNFDIFSENIIDRINEFNEEIESGNSVIGSGSAYDPVAQGLNIIINAIYDLYDPQTVFKPLIFKYLSMLLNPTEHFVKDYIENNYNFEEKSYMEPDIIKSMALDYLACPYRFRIFIEIIDKLSTGVFRELYLKVSKFFSEKINAYSVDTASWIQVKKIGPDISEEFLIDTFYEMINVITDNFLTKISVDELEAELWILFEYIFNNGYFSKEKIENGGISLIKEAYVQLHLHTFVNPYDEFKDDPTQYTGFVPQNMFASTTSPEVNMNGDEFKDDPTQYTGFVPQNMFASTTSPEVDMNGGWNNNPTAYTQFNNILVDLKILLGEYNPGGKYNSGNFDDTILDSIINPNDNLPYSDFVNDSENPENIQRALDKVLPADQGGISKVTISKKLDDFKVNKKAFENNDKRMLCYINRTPPRIKLTDPLFLYTKDFDGLIFLEVYEIVWFIDGVTKAGVPESNWHTTGYVPVYDNPLIKYLTGAITRIGSKGPQSIENIQSNLQVFTSHFESNPLDPRTFKNSIESAININKLKIDLIEKQTEFLKYQKPYYMGKGNLTPQQKIQKKTYINNVIRDYGVALQKLTESLQIPNFLKREMTRVFNMNNRPEGGTLDKQMWDDHNGPQVGGRSVSADNFVNTPEIQSISEYLNNAISRKFLDILGKNKNVICFSSLIDPMGTFGDCSFLNDIKDKKGTIYIYFGVDANNCFKVELQVTPNNNVTVSGNVILKINGMEMINVNINESNFNKKTPFSIANTVSGFTGDVINDRNQAVKKFLGDYLQGMEAISKGYIYYSGDKPATAMYDYMNKAFSPNNSYGGFVDPSNGSISGQSIPAATVQGGGKKKKRSLRKKKKHRDHNLLLSNKYSKSKKHIFSRKKRYSRKKKKHRDHKLLLSNKYSKSKKHLFSRKKKS